MMMVMRNTATSSNMLTPPSSPSSPSSLPSFPERWSPIVRYTKNCCTNDKDDTLDTTFHIPCSHMDSWNDDLTVTSCTSTTSCGSFGSLSTSCSSCCGICTCDRDTIPDMPTRTATLSYTRFESSSPTSSPKSQSTKKIKVDQSPTKPRRTKSKGGRKTRVSGDPEKKQASSAKTSQKSGSGSTVTIGHKRHDSSTSSMSMVGPGRLISLWKREQFWSLPEIDEDHSETFSLALPAGVGATKTASWGNKPRGNKPTRRHHSHRHA